MSEVADRTAHVPSITTSRQEPKLRRVLHEYAAIGFDPKKRARTIHMTRLRTRTFIATAAAVIVVAPMLAVVVHSAAVVAAFLVAGAVSVIISLTQSRTFHGGLATMQDATFLAMQVAATGIAAGVSSAAVAELVAPTTVGDGFERYLPAGEMAVVGMIFAVVAATFAPPLLSRRVFRAPLLLNTLATVTVWMSVAVLSLAVLFPVVAVIGTPANAVAVSITAVVFLVGVGGLRLRHLHDVCEELAAALDEYHVELAAAERDRRAEHRSYLRVERAALTRTFGTFLPSFRSRTDKTTRLGLLFLGAAVTGADTVLRDVHRDRVLHDLGTDGDLRHHAAAFVRDLRSALIPRS